MGLIRKLEHIFDLIHKKFIFYIIYQSFFMILLSFVYINIITKYYNYLGFQNNLEISRFFYVISVFFFLLFLGYRIKDEFIKSIWHILFIICFYPQFIYYIVSSGNILPVISYTIFFTLLGFSDNIKFKKIKTAKLTLSKTNFYILLFLLIISSLPFLHYLPYIDISNLWLENVYKTRALFRELYRVPFIGYLYAPLARVLIPILIIVAYEKRRYFSILVLILLLSYLYLSSGALKSIYFGLFMVIFFYNGKLFIQKYYLFSGVILITLILGTILIFNFNNINLIDLPIRRFLFTPAYLEDFYYQYFSHSPKTYYSHSILKFLFDNPYNNSLSLFIGDYIVGKPGLNANVGVIPDGFVSLGWPGVFLHTFFFIYVFQFIKLQKINPKFFGIVFVYLYYFNTAFLGTLLITHGLLFFLLIFHLLKYKQK